MKTLSNSQGNHIRWINCGKFCAIIAVLVDHTNGILYTNQNIAIWSYFSVSLFILLSGITTWFSYEKKNGNFFVGKRVLKIFTPYILAVFIYQLCHFHYFDFDTYISYLISFNISGPFYFISLFLQLILVSPILYIMLKKTTLNELHKCIFQDSLVLLLIILVSYFTTNYTNIRNIYGGGGRLLGGTYLILYYLGMLFAKHYSFFKKCNLLLSSTAFAALYLVWFFFECTNRFSLDKKFPFGTGFNPPSITSMTMAIIVMGLIFSTISFLEIRIRGSLGKRIIDIMDFIGKNTLYIFLYHRLFLDYLLLPYFSITIKWIKIAVYFGVMIFGPISISMCLNFIKLYLMGMPSNSSVSVRS